MRKTLAWVALLSLVPRCSDPPGGAGSPGGSTFPAQVSTTVDPLVRADLLRACRLAAACGTRYPLYSYAIGDGRGGIIPLACELGLASNATDFQFTVRTMNYAGSPATTVGQRGGPISAVRTVLACARSSTTCTTFDSCVSTGLDDLYGVPQSLRTRRCDPAASRDTFTCEGSWRVACFRGESRPVLEPCERYGAMCVATSDGAECRGQGCGTEGWRCEGNTLVRCRAGAGWAERFACASCTVRSDGAPDAGSYYRELTCETGSREVCFLGTNGARSCFPCIVNGNDANCSFTRPCAGIESSCVDDATVEICVDGQRERIGCASLGAARCMTTGHPANPMRAQISHCI